MRVRKLYYALVVLAVLAGAGVLFHRYWPAPAESPPAPAAPRPVPPPVREPLIRHPIPPPTSTAPATAPAGSGAVPTKPRPAPPPLPPLDRSDPALIDALAALVGRPPLERWLHLKEIVRRVVVTVDNVPRRKLPLRYLPLRPAPGTLRTRRIGPLTSGRYVLSARNYARYTPYVKLMEAVAPDRLARVYIRFYPLFQQAYRGLGYPDGYFNDRLVRAIQVLLAAPVPTAPVRLTRPSVYYKFADPRLEALPAGQKVLVRMGPHNERRVKVWLRAFLKAIERR